MNPNAMLDDDVLTRLLTEGAESFPVPEVELDNELPEKSQRYGKAVKWAAVAAALVGGVLVVQSLGGSTPIGKAKVQAASGDLSRSRLPAALPTSAPLADRGTKAVGLVPQAAAGAPAQLSSTGTQLAPLSGSVPVAAPNQPAPFDDGAKIVKTGTLALIVGDGKVSTVELKVEGIAAGAGGYVSKQKSQEYGDDPSSTVTVRVPVDKFEQVVAQVRNEVKNGVGKVDSASTSGQDVTASYADVTAQIQSLTASRERFLVILGRANTIGETLAVQQRVDSVQQQIDSLKGRLKVLTDQTSMGTLTVTISEKAKAEKKAAVQSGLSKSWDNAKHGFTSGVESIISRSGKGLLVLIVAAIGLVILRTGWRLARRRLV